MYRIIKFIGVALCLGLILTGCAAAEPDAAQRIGQVQGQRLNESANGEKQFSP